VEDAPTTHAPDNPAVDANLAGPTPGRGAAAPVFPSEEKLGIPAAVPVCEPEPGGPAANIYNVFPDDDDATTPAEEDGGTPDPAGALPHGALFKLCMPTVLLGKVAGGTFTALGAAGTAAGGGPERPNKLYRLEPLK
jgi:hypothetical protein